MTGPLRVAALAAAVAVGTVGLVVLAAGFAVTVVAAANLLGLGRAVGIDTQSSENYAFVSGAGPMIVSALGFSGVGVTVLRHLNCHQKGCPRLGRFPLAGGQFKVCRRHHPDRAVRDGLQAHHLAAAHQAHRSR